MSPSAPNGPAPRRLLTRAGLVGIAAAACAALVALDGGLAAARAQEEDLVLARSVSLVEKSIREHPGELSLHLVLANAYSARHRFRDAISALERAQAAFPESHEPSLRIALARRQLGEGAAAIEAYDRVAARAEGVVRLQAVAGRADVQQELERHDEAVRGYREVAATGKADAELWYRLGRSLVALAGQREAAGAAEPDVAALRAEALAALEEARRRRPAHASTRYVLATLLRRLGRGDEAREELAAYRRSREPPSGVDPVAMAEADRRFEAGVAVDLGRALLEGGFARDAFVVGRHALGVDASAVDAKMLIAEVLLRSGKDDEALRALESVVADDPRHAQALWTIGRVHLKRQEPRRAAPYVLRACEARERFPEGWELLAVLAVRGVAYDERKEELCRKALEQRPSAEACARLASVLVEAQRAQEALTVLQEGVRRFPESAELRAALAALEAETGR